MLLNENRILPFFPKKSENIVDVDDVMLFSSLLKEDKKSRPVPPISPLVFCVIASDELLLLLLTDGRADGLCSSCFISPFLAAASLALFNVDFPT